MFVDSEIQHVARFEPVYRSFTADIFWLSEHHVSSHTFEDHSAMNLFYPLYHDDY